jgi:two-component sensor histidine kinase
VHRLSWVDPGDNDALARDFFIHALIDLGACYILYDEEGRCISITGLPSIWSSQTDTRPTDKAIFGDDIAARLEGLRAELGEPGDQANFEIEPTADSFFEFRCRKVLIPDRGIYFILAINDKSEGRRNEKVLRTLLLEVSHRSKNLLAVVQGIASQTARFSGSLDSFLQKFRGRLYALSQSQDLVTDSSWQGAAFIDLLKGQLDRYLPGSLNVIDVKGENILLSPNAAMHIGLALHELIVNSVSHGGVAKERGAIRVSCRRTENVDGPMIEVTWDEQFTDPETVLKSEPKAQFGSVVLEKVVPSSVNGSASHRIDSHGVSYELRFPAGMNE